MTAEYLDTSLEDEYELAMELLASSPGDIHMIGVCGIGMAALAVQLNALGFSVDGCDEVPGTLAA